MQTLQGKELTKVSPYVSKSNFSTKKHYFNPLSKDRTSLKKVFLEDITYIHHTTQKQSNSPWFFGRAMDKTVYIPLVILRTYHVFQNFGYTYIFNFLYPKHVFW